MISQLTSSLSRSVHSTLSAIKWQAIAVGFIAVGAGFLIAACFIILAGRYGTETTALAFAVVFLVLGFVISIAIAARQRKEAIQKPSLLKAAVANPIETAGIVRLLTGGKTTPLVSLALAGLVGVLLSSLRTGEKDQK